MPPTSNCSARRAGCWIGYSRRSDQGFHLALETIWRVVAAANRYVDEQAPWALRRNDPARMRTVLYTLAEMLRHLGIRTQPCEPRAASPLLDPCDGGRWRRRLVGSR